MAVNFSDPRQSIAYLLDPSVPLPETDERAAAAAVSMGGMAGSPFAANNRLRLRDSEQIARLQLGQNLLQPYLNREQQSAMQTQQIAAQAASDAMQQAGLDRRLSAEGQQRLQLAILNGDQQEQDRVLTEAGLDRRQATSLAASLQERTMSNQNDLLRTLLPYAMKGDGGTTTSSGGRVVSGPPGSNDISSNRVGPWGALPQQNPNADVPHWGNPDFARANSGGVGGQLGGVLDKILAQYGLRS